MKKRLMKINNDRILEKQEAKVIKTTFSEKKLKEEKKRIQNHILKYTKRLEEINNLLNEINETDQ